MGKLATVIIPTTGDRGALLPYSVGTVLNQTVYDIEVFIIGDGVNDLTRKMVYQLIEKDERVRFYDHPKDERRGEIYRHEALKQASGEVIFYLCDRDLMLPFHIEITLGFTKKYNFVSSRPYNMKMDNTVRVNQRLHVRPSRKPKEFFSRDEFFKSEKGSGIVLSCVAHTLELYKKLPYGWRTTPDGFYTDQYMLQQILSDQNCRPYFGVYPPSIMYFSRGLFPGIPTLDRVGELKKWYKFIEDPKFEKNLKKLASVSYIYDRLNLLRCYMNKKSVGGK